MENNFFLADWMAGKISDEELKNLVSSADYAMYKALEKGFGAIERPAMDVDGSYRDLLKKVKEPLATPIQRKLIPVWMYAAVASLVLFFGVFQFLKMENTITTSFGEQRNIALNDGSSVTLNAKSRLIYAKNWDFNRGVYLEGEALFKVTKGDKFEVKTKHGSVRVLGTEFNVISRPDFFEVICYEGKVRVEQNGLTTLLMPGKAYRIIGKAKEKQWETSQETATWKSGTSSFNSVPVKYVFEALQNEYKVEIDLKQIDGDKLFTGSFKHSDLDSALSSICLLLDAEYQINESKIRLLKKKSNRE